MPNGMSISRAASRSERRRPMCGPRSSTSKRGQPGLRSSIASSFSIQVRWLSALECTSSPTGCRRATWTVTEFESGRLFTWASTLAPGLHLRGGHARRAVDGETDAEFWLEAHRATRLTVLACASVACSSRGIHEPRPRASRAMLNAADRPGADETARVRTLSCDPSCSEFFVAEAMPTIDTFGFESIGAVVRRVRLIERPFCIQEARSGTAAHLSAIRACARGLNRILSVLPVG